MEKRIYAHKRRNNSVYNAACLVEKNQIQMYQFTIFDLTGLGLESTIYNTQVTIQQ